MQQTRFRNFANSIRYKQPNLIFDLNSERETAIGRDFVIYEEKKNRIHKISIKDSIHVKCVSTVYIVMVMDSDQYTFNRMFSVRFFLRSVLKLVTNV